MPNAFAYLVLFVYPLLAAVLFRLMPPQRALIWTILGGYLFLPTAVAVDLPLLPPINKALVPSLSAAGLAWIAFRRQALRDQIAARREQRHGGGSDARTRSGPVKAPRRGRTRLISGLGVLTILLLPFAVYYTNREPILFATGGLPGIRLYDAFSMALGSGVTILPFLLGWRYLKDPEAHRELLRALVLGGLAYTLLILIELRMSPQLNVWIYGFFPHSFAQHVRDGGYRPIVFLEHGLRVGIFLAMACLAALALFRLERRPRWIVAAVWLCIVLVLSKTTGALAITLALIPFASFGGRRMQILLAAVLAGIVLFYPMLRGAGLVPTEKIYTYVESISPERASSLETRLVNEDALLARANLKPLFGWGGWSRSRVFNEAGYDTSITDGIWVIIMGTSGWVGYLAHFGLLTLPLLVRLLRRKAPQDWAGLGLGLVLVANLTDMLPNSSLTPLTWMIAGALTGGLQIIPAAQPAAEPASRDRRQRLPTRRPAPRIPARASRLS